MILNFKSLQFALQKVYIKMDQNNFETSCYLIRMNESFRKLALFWCNKDGNLRLVSYTPQGVETEDAQTTIDTVIIKTDTGRRPA